MDIVAKFKADIMHFMATYKMSKTAFGHRALGDPHAIPRWLEDGGDPQLSSVKKVYAFMEKYAAERAKKK
jgi:hypothetical protein